LILTHVLVGDLVDVLVDGLVGGLGGVLVLELLLPVADLYKSDIPIFEHEHQHELSGHQRILDKRPLSSTCS
jgi:hypothetical protein